MPTTIKYATANPLDMICAALERSPVTFLTLVEGAVNTHRDAASRMNDRRAREAAEALAAGCHGFAQTLLEYDRLKFTPAQMRQDLAALFKPEHGMNAWMPAFNIACDLIDVPRNVRGAIAERWREVA